MADGEGLALSPSKPSVHYGRAEPPWSTSIPRLLPAKANLGSRGNRCLWEKHRVAKWEPELHSQLSRPHQGGEQCREMLGRKQWAERENSRDDKRLG